MIESIKTNETTKTQDYWLNWFDTNTRKYRTWHFGSDGIAIEFNGTWDNAAKTMTWKVLDGSVERRLILTSDDQYETPVTFRSKDGKVVTESTGLARRVKPRTGL